MEKLITPDEKDFIRVKTFHQKSTAQVEAEVNRIKDPLKLAKRAIAYKMNNGYYDDLYGGIFQRAIKHTLTGPVLEAYTLTYDTLQEEFKVKKELHEAAVKKAAQPIMNILENKVIKQYRKDVDNKNRNKILNVLGLNKKCFGDKINVAKFGFRIDNFVGWGRTHPLTVVVKFEHLNGYFFRDLGYKLVADVHYESDGTAKVKVGDYKTIARIGRRDTEMLKAAIKYFKETSKRNDYNLN